MAEIEFSYFIWSPGLWTLPQHERLILFHLIKNISWCWLLLQGHLEISSLLKASWIFLSLIETSLKTKWTRISQPCALSKKMAYYLSVTSYLREGNKLDVLHSGQHQYPDTGPTYSCRKNWLHANFSAGSWFFSGLPQLLGVNSAPQLCVLPSPSTQSYSPLLTPPPHLPLSFWKSPLVLMVTLLSISIIPITYSQGYHGEHPAVNDFDLDHLLHLASLIT